MTANGDLDGPPGGADDIRIGIEPSERRFVSIGSPRIEEAGSAGWHAVEEADQRGVARVVARSIERIEGDGDARSAPCRRLAKERHHFDVRESLVGRGRL